jgi:hypothetical protein
LRIHASEERVGIGLVHREPEHFAASTHSRTLTVTGRTHETLVREQLDQEQRDGMLAGMPPEMRTMWTEQMEPAFNAFIAEVRR